QVFESYGIDGKLGRRVVICRLLGGATNTPRPLAAAPGTNSCFCSCRSAPEVRYALGCPPVSSCRPFPPPQCPSPSPARPSDPDIGAPRTASHRRLGFRRLQPGRGPGSG